MLWMLLTAALLTVAAAQAKHLGQTLPIAEVVWFRMVLGVVFVLPWLLRRGIGGLATQRLRAHFWRAVLGIGSYVLYIYAISNMLLANAVALAFSTPLWMILVSRLTLGERAGWARGLATAVGFAGVLVIARPDVEISLPAVAALAGALLLSLAMISVKRLSATESSVKIAFYLQLFGALFTLPNTVVSWVTPTPSEWLQLIALGVVGTIGLVTQARAYGTGAPTAVAPVDFTRLPLAVVLGMIFFGEVPEATAFAGMVLILAAIFYISQRERSGRRSSKKTVTKRH
jgi:drug/metabolite transporter (DMT)-like permease